MRESILARVKRIVAGNIQDTVDAMERAGGTTVMREAIREVDRAVEDVKSECDHATAQRLQAVRQQALYRDRLEELTEKAAFAMKEGRKDLAEAALHRQVDFEEQIAKLQKMEEAAGERERQLSESLAALDMRKAHMEEELSAFEAARHEAGLGAGNADGSIRDRERKTDRAEAAFNRAMSGAGGLAGISRSDVAHSSKIADIDAMQKAALISERMAALTAQVGTE